MSVKSVNNRYHVDKVATLKHLKRLKMRIIRYAESKQEFKLGSKEHLDFLWAFDDFYFGVREFLEYIEKED